MKIPAKTLTVLITFTVLSQTVTMLNAQEDSVQTTAAAQTNHTGPRDPFWPVGFSPAPKEEKAVDEIEKEKEEIKSRIKWPKLELKGIIKVSDNKYMATIKGFGIVEEGDILSAKKDGLVYRWEITAIKDSGISRKRLDVREEKAILQKPR
jgi:hypothetical protein